MVERSQTAGESISTQVCFVKNTHPNDWVIEQMPFTPDIATMACYEALGKPIILKNGAKMYPEGWLRFLKLDKDFLNG